MALIVDRVMQSSSKRSLRVFLAGKWYGAALDSGLADKKGKAIKVEIITLDNGPWINKWSLDTEQPKDPWWKWAEEESNREYLKE